MGAVASPSERRVGGVEVKTFGLLVSWLATIDSDSRTMGMGSGK